MASSIVSWSLRNATGVATRPETLDGSSLPAEMRLAAMSSDQYQGTGDLLESGWKGGLRLTVTGVSSRQFVNEHGPFDAKVRAVFVVERCEISNRQARLTEALFDASIVVVEEKVERINELSR